MQLINSIEIGRNRSLEPEGVNVNASLERFGGSVDERRKNLEEELLNTEEKMKAADLGSLHSSQFKRSPNTQA